MNSRLRMVPSAPPADETAGVLENLRLLVSELEKSGEDKRLPNERLLAERLGITRARLRKSLQVLEDEGRLWRGVGR